MNFEPWISHLENIRRCQLVELRVGVVSNGLKIDLIVQQVILNVFEVVLNRLEVLIKKKKDLEVILNQRNTNTKVEYI